jgi:ABC-type multidrug transport system ATPase subunit
VPPELRLRVARILRQADDCLDRKDYDGAIAQYTEALGLQPDNAEAHFNRGIAYRHKGDNDRAIADYTEAIRLEPDDAEAYYNRGIAHDDRKEYDAATADYTEAVRLKPDYAEAYYNRAVNYQSKGDRDRALADYDRAIKARPDYGLRLGSAVRGVSLELRRGEVLGLAGLVGSGRTELLRAVFGADPADGGRIALGDGPDRPPFRSPGEAVRAGVGMVPEDRKGQGLLLAQPVRSNCTLNHLDRVCRGPGWIDPGREGALAGARLAALQTAYASLEQPAAELSGGNQQKLLLARWLLRDGDVLLCDEPTRGIDMAAKAVIHRALGDLAAAGKALLVVSSDLRELMALCDRIAVMSVGRIAAVFERGRWSEEALTAAAFSGYLNPNPGWASP